MEPTFDLCDYVFKSYFCIVTHRELNYFNDDGANKKTDKSMGETYDASDTGSDEVIANLLQAQFNREYDTMLRRTEKKFNRDAKGEKEKRKRTKFFMNTCYYLKLLFLFQ